VQPVVRFKNPLDGDVSWNDLVKGTITISNRELDDLIIARPDGTPTYNFCVVIDDWDMRITHVIRGDDHINNTPRQINILRVLGGTEPIYGHIPMILGPDGEKLSKRHGAVSVMQYADQGYLPEAMINYLSRLGWSHGDDELFSRAQLIAWFDADHLSKSAAQFDPDKLNWINAHTMRQMPTSQLADDVRKRFANMGLSESNGPALEDAVALVLERANTLVHLAQEAALFYTPVEHIDSQLEPLIDDTVTAALKSFWTQADAIEWSKDAIATLMKAVLKEFGLKMPKLAMPLRVLTTGQTQTPSIDAVMALLGKDTVRNRIKKGIQ
jgi:glutamyl-tRNA synthetase